MNEQNPSYENTSPCKSVCPACGTQLDESAMFCPNCGAKRVQEISHEPSATPTMKIKKKPSVILIAITAAILFITVIVLILNGINKGPDLEEIYDEYCDSDWAKLGKDESFLSIDTNPDDEEDYYNLKADEAIEEINDVLELPDSLYEDMLQTTWSMGKQKETFEKIGIEVSWTYHPDKGLEVTYKLIED